MEVENKQEPLAVADLPAGIQVVVDMAQIDGGLKYRRNPRTVFNVPGTSSEEGIKIDLIRTAEGAAYGSTLKFLGSIANGSALNIDDHEPPITRGVIIPGQRLVVSHLTEEKPTVLPSIVESYRTQAKSRKKS